MAELELVNQRRITHILMVHLIPASPVSGQKSQKQLKPMKFNGFPRVIRPLFCLLLITFFPARARSTANSNAPYIDSHIHNKACCSAECGVRRKGKK